MAFLLFLFRPLLIITIIHFAYISFVVVPDITEQVGGLRPLDMLFEGYSFGQASAFLATLQNSGGDAFARFHESHDVIFPALYGVTLAMAIWILNLGWSKSVRIITSMAPLAAALVDYFENASIVRLINTDIEYISPEMVAQASRLTETKFLIVAISFGILAIILGRNYIANAPAVRN